MAFFVEIYRNIADFSSFWGVFWVDVSSPSIAKSSFTSVARLLGSFLDTIDDVLLLISNLKTSWLLILDNADDPDFDYQGYFPSGNTGTIIMLLYLLPEQSIEHRRKKAKLQAGTIIEIITC